MDDKMIAKYIWNSELETKKSTSSGAFFLIAKHFLLNNGIVYGCAFDQEFAVRHIRITNINELPLLQGSKYVQSDMTGVYEMILKDLKNGEKVLFSGTACQAVAVSKYVGSYSNNLYTIDVLCHGVPSPGYWKKYISYLEDCGKGKIVDFSFRNKSKTNRLGYIINYEIDGHKKTIFPSESAYYSAFLKGNSLRPSCYKCPFIGEYYWCDLTLADSNNKKFHPTEAISLLIIRNDKGYELYQYICNKCETKDADINEESKLNKKLVEAAIRPSQREVFYSDNIMNQRINLLSYLKNRLTNMIPTSIKDKIRRKE